MYDLSIIGDVAFEETRNRGNTIVAIGGSGLYAAVGASLITKNYTIVSTVGEDFDFKQYSQLNLPKDNLLLCNLPTGRFITLFLEDGTRKFSSDEGALQIMNRDAIHNLLLSKMIFLSGTDPRKQLEWIEFLKTEGYSGMIAVDVFEGYCIAFRQIIEKVFSNADYIFMNEFESTLLDYSPIPNKVSVIKYGKMGAKVYKLDNESFECSAPFIENVKNTNGAGDILAAVFLSSIIQGESVENALRKGVKIASISTSYDSMVEMICM